MLIKPCVSWRVEGLRYPNCLSFCSRKQIPKFPTLIKLCWSVSFDWREACLPSWCNRKHYGRVSQRYRFESRRGQWALFFLTPSALSFVFLWHASSDSAEVLADAWRRGPADRSWSVSCMIVSRSSRRVSVWSVCFDWREACLPSWCNRKHYGRVSQRYRFESRRGQWALFPLTPSALSFVFLWHTHTRARARTWQERSWRWSPTGLLW